MIVFVHGLWLTGLESAWLRRRLSVELGCEARAFHYHSVTGKLEEVAEALHGFVGELGTESVHLVGHSLGGIVTLRLLERFSDVPPGRVVLMGAPVRGSCVARELARRRWAAAAMGRIVEEELVPEKKRRWDGSREVGVIAGSQALGLGRVLGDLPFPNDGTVAVVETELEGAADSIVLPVSHTGMLFSDAVAHQAAHFLREGRFDRAVRESSS